jgi:hypothetical protein
MRLTAEHKEQMAKILALQQRVEDKDESLRSFRQVVEDKELVMKSTRAEVAALAGLKGEHEERIRLLRQDVESKDAALNAMREQIAKIPGIEASTLTITSQRSTPWYSWTRSLICSVARSKRLVEISRLSSAGTRTRQAPALRSHSAVISIKKSLSRKNSGMVDNVCLEALDRIRTWLLGPIFSWPGDQNRGNQH